MIVAAGRPTAYLERGVRRSELEGAPETETVSSKIADAAAALFFVDPRVRAVGLTKLRTGYGFGVVRNVAIPVAMASVPTVASFAGIPVVYDDTVGEPLPHAILGHGAINSATGPPEAGMSRPLLLGAEIENLAADVRRGWVPTYRAIGSIGCTVLTSDNRLGIASATHVLAPGANDGTPGDEVVQNGGGPPANGLRIGVLADFAALQPSPPGTTPSQGAVLNRADAALAVLDDQATATLAFETSRGLPAITGAREAVPLETVFKVGRTTGYQTGSVSIVQAEFGPMVYPGLGSCWFDRVIVVTGAGFADHGDSGAPIVAASDGALLGLLMGGAAGTYYATPIAEVCDALSCSVVI